MDEDQPSSRTPPGVRELKHQRERAVDRGPVGRTPPGVRELKPRIRCVGLPAGRRTPPGVRELKLVEYFEFEKLLRRTPPGVRELKQPAGQCPRWLVESHPSRGA